MEVSDERLSNVLGATIKGQIAFDAPMHVDAMAILAEAAYTPFGEYVHKIGRTVDDDFRKASMQKARAALSGVDTAGSMARSLEASLEAAGHFDFTDKAGRVWDLKRYTTMVSRTLLREAETQGTANRLVQQGVNLGEVSRHVTNGGPVDVCKEWEGRIIDLDGSSNGQYPTIEEARAAGLWHPNCKHNILPHVPDVDQMIAHLKEYLGDTPKRTTPKPAEPVQPAEAEPKTIPKDPIKAIQAEAAAMRDMKDAAERDRKLRMDVDDKKQKLTRDHGYLEAAKRDLANAKEQMAEQKRRQAAGEDVYQNTLDRIQTKIDNRESAIRSLQDEIDGLTADVTKDGTPRDLAEVDLDRLKGIKKVQDGDLKDLEWRQKELLAHLDPNHYLHRDVAREADELAGMDARIKAIKDKRKDTAKSIKAAKAKLDGLPIQDPGGWDPVQKQAQKVGGMIEAEAKRRAGDVAAEVEQAEEDRRQAKQEAKDLEAEFQKSPEAQAMMEWNAKLPRARAPYDEGAYATFRKEMVEWQKEADKRSAAFQAKRQTFGITEAKLRAQEAGARARAAQKKANAARWEVLGDVRQVGVPEADVQWNEAYTTPAARPLAMEHAIRFLPADWIKMAGKMGFKIIGGRCYYDGNMRINKDGHAALHETVHHMQRNVDGFGQLETAFYNERVTGPDGKMEPIRSLQTIYPGSGYKRDEKARVDRFPNAYMGKVYEYGLTQMNEPRELLTCAIDDLSRGIEPWLFDPDQADLLNFTLGVLGGL
jgi:hypothetical protein